MAREETAARKTEDNEWVPGVRPSTATSGVVHDPLFEYLLRLADDRLILGHRLSEWCGHAPILEEDIAISNIALDLIGQAASLLKLAAEYEGKGRSEDALAYLRDAVDFRNCQLVEQPKGDFAVTIVRQFLFDAYDVLLTDAIAQRAAAAGDGLHGQVGGVAAKALKEAKYHLRHSSEWVRMLGDGTGESHTRAQRALDQVWPFTSELFAADAVDAQMVARGIAPEIATLRGPWLETVRAVVRDATLTLPHGGEPGPFQASGGRVGRHSEHLGHLLAEMQIVARSHPGASW